MFLKPLHDVVGNGRIYSPSFRRVLPPILLLDGFRWPKEGSETRAWDVLGNMIRGKKKSTAPEADCDGASDCFAAVNDNSDSVPEEGFLDTVHHALF